MLRVIDRPPQGFQRHISTIILFSGFFLSSGYIFYYFAACHPQISGLDIVRSAYHWPPSATKRMLFWINRRSSADPAPCLLESKRSDLRIWLGDNSFQVIQLERFEVSCSAALRLLCINGIMWFLLCKLVMGVRDILTLFQGTQVSFGRV